MSQNADSMSVLHIRAPFPSLSKASIASSKEQYETLDNSDEIPSLIQEQGG